MAKKPALGRGLSALLENASKSVKDSSPEKSAVDTDVADLPEVIPAAEVGNVAGPTRFNPAKNLIPPPCAN